MLRLSEEVAQAVAENRPLVALESTIIAHGMPYPQNLETGRALEDEVRRAGAVPATVAILEGSIRVGLEAHALERLATDASFAKISRRDMSVVMARRGNGATTVSATMIAAHMAGIAVFATGGIGGVHRGVAETMDVSADLQELSRTPVAVVCAGAKSILDLPRTLEYLETRGVPVIGMGTDELPAFYARTSGLPLPHATDTPLDVARILQVQRKLGLDTGCVIAVPPPEETALPAAMMDRVIANAVDAAERSGISGHDVTPFLLSRIAEETGGRSLAANIALARNNARAAAEIAGALTALDQRSDAE